MSRYSVAETKDKLSSLIARARAGEEVVITNRGAPVARLVPEEPLAKRDVKAATTRLMERLKDKKPLPIPADNFRDWLYEGYEY